MPNQFGAINYYNFEQNLYNSVGNYQNGNFSAHAVPTKITYTNGVGGGQSLNFPGEITTLNQQGGTTPLSFGLNTQQRVAQSFVCPATGQISALGLHRLMNTGTLTGTISVLIKTDNAGSPSSTIVEGRTYPTSPAPSDSRGSVITDFLSRYRSVTLTPFQTYWIEFAKTNPSNTNYPNIAYDPSGTYGSLKRYNGTTRTTIPGTLSFSLITESRIDLGSDISLPYNNFTIGFRYKRPASFISNYMAILTSSKGGVSGQIEYNGTDIRRESFTNSVSKFNMPTGILQNDTNRHHYLIRSSPTNIQLFVDSQLTSTNSPNLDTANQRFRYIGAKQSRPRNYGYSLHGCLDHLIAFDTAISDTLIKDIYNEPYLKKTRNDLEYNKFELVNDIINYKGIAQLDTLTPIPTNMKIEDLEMRKFNKEGEVRFRANI